MKSRNFLSVGTTITRRLLLIVLHFYFSTLSVFSWTKICSCIWHGLHKAVMDISHPERILLFHLLKWQFYGIKGRVLLLIITAANKHFSALKEYFRKNAQVYQYLYAILHPKYFCRVDNPGVKSKLAFDLTFGGYKNEREKIQFTSIKKEVVDSSSSRSNNGSDHNSVVIEQQQ